MPRKEAIVHPTHLMLRWSTPAGTVITTFELLEFCEVAASRLGPTGTAPHVAAIVVASAVVLLRQADGLDWLGMEADRP